MIAFPVKLILLAVCSSIWFFKVLATSFPDVAEGLPSYDYGIATNELVKRQAAQMYSPSATVTGVHTGTGPNGSAPLRPNILDMEQDTDMWTLYLLALDMMQYMDQSQLFSWYQVAGIHGRPYLPWDGVQATPGNQNNGYCTHVSILFPTWHRPYLALYEQLLYGLALQIAGYWPAGAVQDRYVAAAQNFRIPYWDWAAVPPSGQNILPDSVATSSVVVDGPAGEQTIANPLFSFQFKPLNTTELPDFPLNQWQTTMRYPSANTPSAISQNNLVAQQLNNNAASFRNRLYNLFTNYPNYVTFSNEAWIPTDNSEGYDSIESIHDVIHGMTGSGGHMTYIEYSGFDPIFWLHHAMIDRCFALWQVLYPNSYVTPEPSQYGTFTTSPGQIENISTPLTPFRSDQNGDFWTPSTARFTTTFGYAYAETANDTTPALMQARVTTAINTLYGNTAPANTIQNKAIASVKTILDGSTAPANNLLASLANLIPKSELKSKKGPKSRRSPEDRVLGMPDLKNRELAANSPINFPTNLAPNGQYREWIANLRVSKYALSGPFFIHIFLGNFSSDSFQWTFDPNLVGSHCVFAHAAGSSCSECNLNQRISATIPLTSALLEDIQEGMLASLEPADVEGYLKENMQYRITMVDDTAVPNEDVPDLVIEVVSTLVQKPACVDEFPRWGALQVHLNSSTCLTEPFRSVASIINEVI